MKVGYMTDKRIKEPCPFCGEKAENIRVHTLGSGNNRVICPTCRATFDSWESKQDAIDRWNRRWRE